MTQRREEPQEDAQNELLQRQLAQELLQRQLAQVRQQLESLRLQLNAATTMVEMMVSDLGANEVRR